MLVIRDVFQAKPGQASKLAKFMKDTMQDAGQDRTRVLTDLVSDYNTVVLEFEVKDLAEFEQQMKEYMEKPEWRQRMAGYTDMWQSGKREILRVM